MDPATAAAEQPDDDEGAMALALGFTSFGTQARRPNKKRRFHADDAVVALPASLPPKPPPASASASGANALPLHPRDVLGVASASRAATDADEIDLLDGDEEDDGGSGGGGRGVSADRGNAPAGLGAEGCSGTGTGAGDDGGLSGAGAGYENGHEGMHFQPGLSPGALDQGYAPGHHWGRGRGGGGGQWQRGVRDAGLSRGASGAPWWTDYYDPSFNENPWERLERDRGLKPQGSGAVRPTAT